MKVVNKIAIIILVLFFSSVPLLLGQQLDDKIELPFVVANDFSQGLAFVIYEDATTKEQTRGYVNKDGKFQIIIDKESIGGSFHNGYAWLLSKSPNGVRYGFINRNGALVVKPRFRVRTFGTDQKTYFDIHNFEKEGVVWVWDDKYALLNFRGELLTPFIYDRVSYFKNGLAIVGVLDDGSPTGVKEGLIDYNANILLPMDYRSISFSSDCDLILIKKDGRYGYADRRGKVVIEIKYDDASVFSEGLAFVKIADSKMIIGRSGECRANLPDDCCISASKFCEGIARIKVMDKYGFIDMAGNYIVEPKYDYATNFSFGLSMVQLKNNRLLMDRSGREASNEINIDASCTYRILDNNLLFVAMKDSSSSQANKYKYGYISHNGRVIIPCDFNDIGEFRQGVARVREDNLYGFIDLTGKILAPILFDEANDYHEGFAIVGVNGKYGFLNLHGELLRFQTESDLGAGEPRLPDGEDKPTPEGKPKLEK
jgi:hypothetical protein